jgi:hypothetical protein
MALYDDMLALLPRKKQTPNGWMSFNAVCCQHNNDSRDTKMRGGLKRTDDNGVTYHCFNCGFKASWRPGRNLGKRMQNLLRWMGATDEQVNKIAFECLKTQADKPDQSAVIMPDFVPRKLPSDSVKIDEKLILIKPQVLPIVEYMYSRGLSLDDSDFYWSPSSGFADRLLIPITVDKRLVGYIGRKTKEGKPKYITEHPAHVVFNLDNQPYDHKFVLVFEGSIDALLLGGVALLTNEISREQALQINGLGKQVIVVPDRDKAGERLIEHSLELGWSVAFPDWGEETKDAAEAVIKYGRLSTLLSIINNVETNPLKIKLRMKI